MKKYIIVLVLILLVSCSNPLDTSVIIYNEVGSGSGSLIESGVVLSVSHVVKEKNTIELMSGEQYDIKEILYRDEELDIIVFTIDCVTDHLEICYKFKQGDEIFTYSNPLAIKGVTTKGIISKDDFEIDNKFQFMFTAPISAGSSGGAVLNKKGEIIGIIVSQLDGQNNNLAIPVIMIKGRVQWENKTQY